MYTYGVQYTSAHRLKNVNWTGKGTRRRTSFHNINDRCQKKFGRNDLQRGKYQSTLLVTILEEHAHSAHSNRECRDTPCNRLGSGF